LLVLQHPVTTEYASAEQQIHATLDAVNRYHLPAIWMWPNMDAGSDAASKVLRHFREVNRQAKIHFFTNLGVEDFARVLNNAACIVGNSSSALREASYLGTPAVNIGSRQGGRERASNVVDVDHDADAIAAAIERQVAHGRYPRSTLFGDGHAAEKMVEVLAVAQISLQKRLSYVD
jgi:UDP-N-acetylglucosamine 2-epimerase